MSRARSARGASALLVFTALALHTVSRSALAQDIASAEALFKRGRADMDKGDYKSGCKAIAESQRLDPRPGTLFTLSVCEMRWGHIATAAARYNDYLSLYERLSPAERARQKERAQEAKTQRAALLPLIPELTLTLPPGAPAGVVIERDGAVVSEAALGVSLPVDPGEHVITTKAPGANAGEQRISIAKGEKKQVVLEVRLAPEAKADKAPPEGAEDAEEPGSGRRIATYVVGGVGVTGLVLGGVMGGLALGKKGEVNAHCGNGIGLADKAACDTVGLEAVKSGKTFALVSTVGFAAGAAAVVGVTVLLLTEPKAVKPGVGARRGWVAAEVSPLGSGGAMVGVRGGW